MMGSGGSGGFDFNSMMNGAWSGGWPMFLLGALVVAGVVLLVIWAVRSSRRS